ncbi:MAG: ribokinase, partial [Nitrosopumilus sp.]|nr:ribokinase [Nitrosopumilus sp.]
MKLALFSHCAIDTITIGDQKYEQIGGAACYCGITARQFKFDVELFTKFGNDFPKQYLTEHKINFTNAESEKKSTKFSIRVNGADRTLKLENQCEPIEYSSVNADCHLVSPIYHEISDKVFSEIKKDSNFLFVDPQGFLRQADSQNNVQLQKTDLG